ncbi:hypothetical protein [Thermus sp.]|uniref:hypothetical protein n=1 Tax=Thermus sp. TaxID=275 RepID=UPI00298EE88C|nr:hypothetical protein [Thermus sp.]MDW8357865.1 hypothetical protein [Thermus sp.]
MTKDLEYRLETGRHLARLLEIPALIGEVSRQLTALRAERRQLERVAKEVWAREFLAAQGRSREEREAQALARLGANPDWNRMQARLEQLAAAIDKLQGEKETLEHERKALYGAIIARHTEVLEAALASRLLTPHGLPPERGRGN